MPVQLQGNHNLYESNQSVSQRFRNLRWILTKNKISRPHHLISILYMCFLSPNFFRLHSVPLIHLTSSSPSSVSLVFSLSVTVCGGKAVWWWSANSFSLPWLCDENTLNEPTATLTNSCLVSFLLYCVHADVWLHVCFLSVWASSTGVSVMIHA